MYVMPRDTSPQERRALRRHLDSRGPGEDLHTVIRHMLDAIESGAPIKVTVLGGQWVPILESLKGQSNVH